ncbi:glycosyl transferase [Spirochaetia bacterium]|nr:glycosyl transferase [Spirochaetia bacterium]
MIPKRIFYVWGYNEPKSRMTEICIENWRLMLPGYEIIEVNENSPYFDFEYEYSNCLWFKTVYDLKMWASVSDYMRVKVLHDQGGIYFDTDVTVYKDFEPLLGYKMFIGNSLFNLLEPAVFGAEKGRPVLNSVIEFYHDEIWKSSRFQIPDILTNLINNGIYDDIRIFPYEYFSPFHPFQQFTYKYITENTYAVHWCNASWFIKKYFYFLTNKHRIPLKTLLRQMKFIELHDPKADSRIFLDDVPELKGKLPRQFTQK